MGSNLPCNCGNPTRVADRLIDDGCGHPSSTPSSGAQLTCEGVAALKRGGSEPHVPGEASSHCPILRKNVSLCPTIFSTYFLFFTLFLHCPRFCHCSLNILALFSNYLSLINSLYLASSLINFLKFIMIKNVIPFTNYMSCFLLLCLSISFLQIHLKFFLKLSCPAFYESDFSEYLKWLLPLHFFCLIANFVFAPHNHFISICKHSSFMTLDFFPCSLPWIISSTTIFYCRT